MRISFSFISRLSLLGLLVLCLVACGSTGGNTNTTSTTHKTVAQGGTKSTPRAAPGKITEFDLPAPIVGGQDTITAGSDGNLWFTYQTTTGENGVGRITPTGQTKVVASFPLQDRPLEIVTGSDGNVWFTTIAGELGRITIDPTNKFKFTGFAGGSGFYTINDITTGPDGNLWFTRGLAIMRITPSAGSPTSTVTPFPLSATSSPNQIAAGPDGNLWFTDQDKAAIGRITPTGKVTTFSLHAPAGDVTIGPDKNIWFTEGTLANTGIGYITL
jgi:streptogramin lyase